MKRQHKRSTTWEVLTKSCKVWILQMLFVNHKPQLFCLRFNLLAPLFLLPLAAESPFKYDRLVSTFLRSRPFKSPLNWAYGDVVATLASSQPVESSNLDGSALHREKFKCGKKNNQAIHHFLTMVAYAERSLPVRAVPCTRKLLGIRCYER